MHRFLPLVVVLSILALIPIGLQADPAAAQSNAARVETLSPSGQAYIDPEIMPGGDYLTYQSEGNIYLAELNPDNGLFANPPGQDILVDSGATPPIETFNGPEFGIDREGWALYYAKPHNGITQIWRATPNPNSTSFETSPISSGARHATQLLSRNPNADSVRIAAIEGTWQNGTAVWFDEDSPEDIYEIDIIENGVAPLRWVDNSASFVYSLRSGDERGQIALFDTDTNTERIITNDPGDKSDPYGWFAPEFGGEMLVLAILDNAAVAVYRDLGGDYWERIATLSPPPQARFDFVSSAEPAVVNGKSYMSLIIKDAGGTREAFSDSEVWLFDLYAGSSIGYAERCDSGEANIARSDPEIYVGSYHVFVYYNVINTNGSLTPYAMRRCQSEIDLNTTFNPPNSSNTAQAPDNCEWIMPTDTDPLIDRALEAHYICRPENTFAEQPLLVFFPGTGALPSDYTLFVQESAALGMPSIGLSYHNPRSVNLQICPGDPDPNCHANARQEVITGEALHDGVDVDVPNSINNRIVRLLERLHATDPAAGWDQYLDGEQPNWGRIVVAGHSQGAGMAAYVAHLHRVERAILFAWVDLVLGRPAPWLYEDHATPGERFFYFEHVDDRLRGEAAKIEMYSLFGFDGFGEVNADESAPPYGGAHILLTALAPSQTGGRPSAAAHNMVVVDSYTPLTSSGVPLLREVWRYLLTMG